MNRLIVFLNDFFPFVVYLDITFLRILTHYLQHFSKKQYKHVKARLDVAHVFTRYKAPRRYKKVLQSNFIVILSGFHCLQPDCVLFDRSK